MAGNPAATGSKLRVAIVHEAFFGESAGVELLARLKQATEQGADLAVLCELPLNHWMAVDQKFDVHNTEAPGTGIRQGWMQQCARAAGIALVGGAIMTTSLQAGADEIPPEQIDASHCHNTAVLYDEQGELRLQYGKMHLPQEEGYWEASHYSPSTELPRTVSFSPTNHIDKRPWTVGIQVCSDIMRPAGAAFLASQGVQLLLHPRATPLSSYQRRWKPVLRAAAITSAAYVISVNRPSVGQADTPCGGASLVVSPCGDIILETTDPLTVVTLDMAEVDSATKGYPGYLEHSQTLIPRAV